MPFTVSIRYRHRLTGDLMHEATCSLPHDLDGSLDDAGDARRARLLIRACIDNLPASLEKDEVDSYDPNDRDIVCWVYSANDEAEVEA